MAQQAQPNPAQTYNDYFGPGMFTPWAKKLLSHAQPSKGQRVLDLACGTGLVTEQIAAYLGESGSISGVDFSPGMLSVARARKISGPSVEWHEADAGALPFPDDHFDLAFCQQGFQFFPDASHCAREALRVLKPGGTAVVSVWSGTDDHALFEALFGSVANRLGVPLEATSKPVSFGGPDRLKSVFEGAGFSEVRVVTESHDARFSSVDSWVKLSVLGAAAAIPAFGELSDEERARLVPQVAEDVDEVMKAHIQGDELVMPTTAHTAVAVA